MCTTDICVKSAWHLDCHRRAGNAVALPPGQLLLSQSLGMGNASIAIEVHRAFLSQSGSLLLADLPVADGIPAASFFTVGTDNATLSASCNKA
jgi:hypothetical protein